MSSEDGDPKTPYNEISDEQLQHIEKQELQEMIEPIVDQRYKA